MTLNELVRFAKVHNIDFDKDIICLSQFCGEVETDGVEQIAMKETDEGNKLVIVPFVYAYDAIINKEFGFCDVVNSVDSPEKDS